MIQIYKDLATLNPFKKWLLHPEAKSPTQHKEFLSGSKNCSDVQYVF